VADILLGFVVSRNGPVSAKAGIVSPIRQGLTKRRPRTQLWSYPNRLSRGKVYYEKTLETIIRMANAATWKPTSARAMPVQGVGSDPRSTVASRLGFLQDVDVGNRTFAAIANGRLRCE